MAISFPCPHCAKTLNAPDAAAGKSGRCPHCKATFAVPMPVDPIDDLLDDVVHVNHRSPDAVVSRRTMATVQLRCIDKGHKGELWALDLAAETVRVKDSQGTVVAEFAPEDAFEFFQLPSFSESIKYFGVRLGKKLLRFDVSRDGLKQIKAFLNRTIVAAGPEAVLAVRNEAIRDTAIGVSCVIGGVGMTVWSYSTVAAEPRGGEFTVLWGLVFFGLIMIGKGIYGFVQYGNLTQA